MTPSSPTECRESSSALSIVASTIWSTGCDVVMSAVFWPKPFFFQPMRAVS
jgi:hypothetical protein